MVIPDVLVIGEILVELSSTEPLDAGTALTLNFSGDALNSAAAAAAAGAHTALLARVPDDELGDRLIERVVALGIDTAQVLRVPGQHGLYLQHADPSGAREFTYVRRGSAGSGLGPGDIPLDLVAKAGAVLASGIACAISPLSAEAVRVAASASRCFVYDPNWRPRLVSAAGAGEHLRALAPYTRLVTPAWPREAQLAGEADDPVAACTAIRRLGVEAVALTRGVEGVLLDDAGRIVEIPVIPAPAVVDQTGAGDSFAGTVTARLALGDTLEEAVRLGVAAASLSVSGLGGTGHVATLEETRAHATNSPAPASRAQTTNDAPAGPHPDQAGRVVTGQPVQTSGAAGQPDRAGGVVAGEPDRAGGVVAGQSDTAGGVVAGEPDQASGVVAGQSDTAGGAVAGQPDQTNGVVAGQPDRAGGAAGGSEGCGGDGVVGVGRACVGNGVAEVSA